MFETPKYPRRPRYQCMAPNGKCNCAECPPPPPQKKKKKKKNTPTPHKNFILVISLESFKRQIYAALWNGHTVKQSSDLKTSSAQYFSNVPMCQGCHLCCGCLVDQLKTFVCHVHSHQYSWFSRISSTVPNRSRRSTSLLKRSVLITSISPHIKLVTIAFQSVPCNYAEWAILGDDVRAASRRLIFYWNTATGAKYP